MNPDLTFNTIVFKHSYDIEGKHVRTSTARDVNTPDVLITASQAYVDSVTKVPGIRLTGRIDRWDLDAQLRKIQTSCYLVYAIPESAATAAVTNVTTTFKALVADASFMAALINREL
jgi:hypothetical protein